MITSLLNLYAFLEKFTVSRWNNCGVIYISDHISVFVVLFFNLDAIRNVNKIVLNTLKVKFLYWME